MGKRVFVTVGTTKFDELIDTMSSEPILNKLLRLGYSYIQFQTGTGNIKYKNGKYQRLKLNYQPFFDNIIKEIEKADLVISHAGAGSCLDVLHVGKPLLVVVNDQLMDNHQLELASQLEDEGYLYYCMCDTIEDNLDEDFTDLIPYPPGRPLLFANYVDKVMGFS